MYETIIEQLKGYCDCIKDLHNDDTILEKNVEEMIQLVSNMTCWNNSVCETFLNSEREEIIDVCNLDKCVCNGTIVDIEPYYVPLQPSSLKVYLVEIDGIHETEAEMDQSEYAYLESMQLIRIDLSDYVRSDRCGCKPIQKLRIVYDAGYEMIPDCLLKLFCDLLHVIYDKNSCDCSACQACDGENTQGAVEYDKDDEISPKIDVYLNALIESGYQYQLGSISLCGRKRLYFTGLVV